MNEQLARKTEARAEEELSYEESLPKGGPSGRPLEGALAYVKRVIAAEISAFSRYFNKTVQYQPREEDTGMLLQALDCPDKAVARSLEALERKLPDDHGLVLLNGNINHDHNIQGTLASLKPALSRSCRVAVVAYNPYLSVVYKLANRLGIRKGQQPDTFVTFTDLANIAKLSGYDVVSARHAVFSPFRLWGLGDLVNRISPTIPLLKYLSLTTILVLRPNIAEDRRPSLSIVIPARNERGNIRPALLRLRELRDSGVPLEVIFVEGHSKDGTWEEIQKVVQEFKHEYELQAFQQTGKGKADAVRLGFSRARKELVTILDADLTMPPERLGDFYAAYCEGHADFINGNRLVYPMEGEAMRPLNHLGNIFFAKALSFVLGVRLGDSLCGTKLMTKADYRRFVNWRRDFGEFDPFGDFELLFPAAQLGLGIMDIPVRYRDRTYGSTNISRFRHGLMLFKMTWVGLLRLRLGRVKGMAYRADVVPFGHSS